MTYDSTFPGPESNICIYIYNDAAVVPNGIAPPLIDAVVYAYKRRRRLLSFRVCSPPRYCSRDGRG